MKHTKRGGHYYTHKYTHTYYYCYCFAILLLVLLLLLLFSKTLAASGMNGLVVGCTGALAGLNSPTRSIYSIKAVGAASPSLRPVLRTLVYPPSLRAYLGAMTSKSLRRASSVRMILAAWRRAWRLPRLPRVTTLSANRRNSLALATVVWIRSCSISCVTIVLRETRERGEIS